MTSVDTNLLFAWLNKDHPLHPLADRWFLEQSNGSDLILCELCLLELYCLVRNPSVVRKPLDGRKAVELIESLRSHSHWRVVDYPGGLMGELWSYAKQADFPRRRVFDVRLALTLRSVGVKEFATMNTKDFNDFGFSRVWNPLEG